MSDAAGEPLASDALNSTSFSEIEALLRQETAGVYEIERVLGRGGMAVVYLAREVHLARHVAIKVLPPALTFGHGVERFKREAKTAAALDHPHIIPIYRVSTSGALFWYAMKFLEGESLEQLLRSRGRLPLPEALGILGQIAEALDYAHAHQVVHRDIKPANVMLDQRQRVIVTDFGIAKALSEGKLTATGSVIGTPNYMAPEQGMGMMVTGASDQYSVAVMAYRMLAGFAPFEGDSALDILHRHCTTPPPPLESAVPGLPRNVHLAVHRGLEKSPERRFPTVSALVDAMREAGSATAQAVSAPVADTTAATLLVSGVGTNEAGPSTSPLRVGKNLPGRPRRRTEEGDPASTGERWRRPSGQNGAIRDDSGPRASGGWAASEPAESRRTDRHATPPSGDRQAGAWSAIPDGGGATASGEPTHPASGEGAAPLDQRRTPDSGASDHRASDQHMSVPDPRSAPSGAWGRRASDRWMAVPEEPSVPSGEQRRRASDRHPAVSGEAPARFSGGAIRRDGPPSGRSEEFQPRSASWERRVTPDRRRNSVPNQRGMATTGPRAPDLSGERSAIPDEREIPAPVEWLPSADEPPGRSSGARRRPSGQRTSMPDDRVRRTSGAWGAYPPDEWTPDSDEWVRQATGQRAASTSVALRRWSPPDGPSAWDEPRPRWRVGSRHRLRQRPKKRRLPVSLLVGLATIFGGGVGAAGLLTWETIAAPTGTLVVDNLPRNASVLVDSKPAERQVIQLSPGPHQLEILAPGMESHREMVTITANTTVRIRASQKPLEPPDSD